MMISTPSTSLSFGPLAGSVRAGPEGCSAGGDAGAGRGVACGLVEALFCLDHLCAVGPPYFVNQVVQRNASGPSRSAASRHARRHPIEPFSPGVVVRGPGRCEAARGGAGGSRSGWWWAGRSCARRDVHSALERCISPSRCAVRSARPSAKCTSRRPGAVRVGPRTGDRRSRRPCRGPRPSVCTNLLQRPGSCRSAGGGSSIFRAFIRGLSRACPSRCGRL